MHEWICYIDEYGELEPSNELVRCKDCKYYDGDGTCLENGIAMLTGDWFCADGERREDDE